MTDESTPSEGFAFECARCSEPGTVPFEPRSGKPLLCRDCWDETGGKIYDLSKMSRAPRRKHGTRVVFEIVCSSCGAEERLDYVPKGVPMSEILCTDCMSERSGEDSRWKLVREAKDHEQRRKPKHDIVCPDCGVIEQVTFTPEADRVYYCYSCHLRRQIHEEAGGDKANAPKHDLGDHAFIRRRKPSE